MSNEAPYMPFWVKDWLADANVIRMTPIQEYCYFRLCLFCWEKGELPNNPKELAKLCKNPKDFHTRVWPAISAQFGASLTPFGKSILRNKRVMEEFEKMLQIKKAKSDAGKKGMEKRWGKA